MASTKDPPPVYGLLTQDGVPVPLTQIDVNVQILGFVAEVTSSLYYSNYEEIPVEAEFTFPVDDASAVFRFEAEIEGRHIVAEIQEKEQAKLTYQDAIAQGRTAMLMKEDGKTGDIFRCTLGNLPPKTDANIRFSYAIELPQEPDGRIRFTLPTVLNPRYSSDAGGVVAAEGATYSDPTNIQYQFSFNATVRGYHNVISVTSQSDKLDVQQNPDNSKRVSLVEKFSFDHDLSFLVEYERCYTPQVILETGNPDAAGILKEDMLMVNFLPKLQESATTTGEFIFVIDRSGSMSGNRMDNAKEALFLFLKSLPADCYFNIVSFGSRYSSLFNGSSKYTPSNLEKALGLQESMHADMGGTEMLKPFQHIVGKNPIKGHPRQVILLTDGEISDRDSLIGVVAANASTTRVFTLGIGSGVSTALIYGLARAGNGKAEILTDQERIQPKVISLLKCATQPAVTDIEIKWNVPEDVTIVSIPEQPPPFIGIGERLCLYALMTGDKKKSFDKCAIEITGKCDGEKVEYKMTFPEVSEAARSGSLPLHRLAAKNQIKLLEIEGDRLIFDYHYHRLAKASLEEMKEKTLQLSTNANVISRLTAFVAIDKDSKKKVEGEMMKRSCPVPVATPEFSDALSMNYGQERFRSLAMSRGYAGSASSIILYADYSLCEATAAPRGRSCSGCGGGGGGLAMPRGIGYAGTARLVTLSAEPLCMAAPKGGSCCGGGGGGGSKMRSQSKRSSAYTPTASSSGDSAVKRKSSDVKNDDKLIEMIRLQDITGYWTLSKELTSLIEVNNKTIESIDLVKDSTVKATLVVIVWLRSKFNKRHDEWEMIVKKALQWLRSKINTQADSSDMFEKVKQSIWPNGL